ncbi:MAG: type I-E CRISPR-associated protein Cas7/Cse4/CasC [Propionicimonas sp.]|jgi:CRISPR system Cascade subunit CasC
MNLNIDVHVIQSVPPSNLNRDDTGSPKTGVYGGVRRARVSSQAWKRATRRDFEGYLDKSEFGVRTKRAVELLSARILALDPSLDTEAADAKATAVLNAAGLQTKAKRKAVEGDRELTEYLVFFSNLQLDKLAALAIESGEQPSGRDAKQILKEGNSFDVALFGRMVANDADLNVDAACQVAHALSTHAVTNEFDYYTAVDDENPDAETGAGMIGTVEFNSATLYRYATVNVAALQGNLGQAEATGRAVEAFVRSFVQSMPTGKQNTFGNGTLPEAVVVMARQGRAVNLVGAFEEAVSDRDGGFVKASCQQLADYAAEVAGAYANAPVATWIVRVGERTAPLDGLSGERVDLDSLVAEVGSLVRESVAESA